jgi:integrase
MGKEQSEQGERRRGVMAVRVREKVAGSGVFWVFVNHEGIRKAKKVGSEKTALEVAEVIKARIALGE